MTTASEGLHRRTSLGLQTHTTQYPLAYVVRSEQDLRILEEIFRWRGTRYQVIQVSLPDLLGDNFPQLMEDEKTTKGLDVFLVYDMQGNFISRFTGDQSKFEALS